MNHSSASTSSSHLKRGGIIAGIAAAAFLTGAILTVIFWHKDSNEGSADQSLRSSHSTIEAVNTIHHQFAVMQQMDENYAVMLGSPGVNMDSADQVILKAEAGFTSFLDTFQQNIPSLSASDRPLLDSLVANFRVAMLNRQYLSGIRLKLNGSNIVITPRDKEINRLQLLLRDKDRQLNVKNSSIGTSPDRRDSLARLLNAEEARSTGLLDIVNNIKTENASLRTQIASLQTGQQKSVDINRYQSLENQIDELSAELYLAQVDCNLTRVDADKIISTSRQRKQLLNEALEVLDNLSQSDNSEIKAKALLKREYLKQVSAKIRE